MTSRLKQRPGFALIAALWLIVAIATIALEFSLQAREQRATTINVSEHAQALAAAYAGIETARANFGQFIVQVQQHQPIYSQMRVGVINPSDPLLGIDSMYSDSEMVGGGHFSVYLRDGGEFLNINSLTTDMWRTFLVAAGQDYDGADKLSQSIMNWRTLVAHPRGATRDDYIRTGAFALPTGSNFTDVSELRNVMGMTPELYAKIAPVLSVSTTGQLSFNHASGMALHALPGFTDEVVNIMLAERDAQPFFWIADVKQRMPEDARNLLEQDDSLFRPFVSNAHIQEALAISTGWAPGGYAHVTVVARLSIDPATAGQILWSREEDDAVASYQFMNRPVGAEY